jgi:pre-rRNA-processing protein RIX1
MSLPPELRALCHQLSSTPSTHLPCTTPLLLRNVLRCGGPLSSEASNTSKPDTSETTLLVHKLKTQISTLLHGKSIEGRCCEERSRG